MDRITQEANSVGVEIFGQAYSLCGSDPGYILKLAEYVDSKMRTIADEDAMVDSAQLAVLAAIRIADEYHRLKETPSEEETEETDSSDSLVAEVGQMEKPFTEEDKQHKRERRQRHYTKRRYERDLLEVVNDESIPAKERRGALLALGRSRGYHRRPPAKT